MLALEYLPLLGPVLAPEQLVKAQASLVGLEQFLLFLAQAAMVLQRTLAQEPLMHKVHTIERMGKSIATECSQKQQAHTGGEHTKASSATDFRIPSMATLEPVSKSVVPS